MIEEQILNLVPEVARQFSQVNILGSWITISIGLILLVLGIIGMVVGDIRNEEKEGLAVLSAILFVTGGFILICSARTLIGWYCYPEGMILKTLIHK